MARIPDASDIEPVSARKMRAPGVWASAEDFGAGTCEALAGAGLRLARKAAQSRQPAEDDAFVTAGMAEGRRRFARIVDDGKGDGGVAAPEDIDGALSGDIPTLIDGLRSEGRFEPSPRAVKELTGRLSALGGVFSVRNAARAHRARRDRYGADLAASMGAFGDAAFANPDHLDDVLADARDAIGRAERHFPGSAPRLREAHEPAIVEAAMGGWIARDPEMAVGLLEAGAYDSELPVDRKAALLAEAEAARDQGSMVSRAAILGSLEDHLEDLAAGGAGIPGLGSQAAQVLDEADTKDFLDREETVRETYDTLARYRYAPAPELIAELDRRRPKPGERPSPAVQRKFEVLERAAERLLDERRRDGAAWVMEMPAVRAVFDTAVPMPETGGLLGAGAVGQTDPQTYRRALSVRWDIQGEIGLDEGERRVLTVDEAAEESGRLGASDPAKLVAQVAEHRDRFGNLLPKALEELVAAGLDPRVTVLAGAVTKPALANELARVIASGNVELRRGLPDPDVAAIRGGIHDRIAVFVPPATWDRDEYIGHPDGLPPMIEGLALTYYRQTGDVDTSIVRATKELFPNARTMEWRPGEDSPDAVRKMELRPEDRIHDGRVNMNEKGEGTGGADGTADGTAGDAGPDNSPREERPAGEPANDSGSGTQGNGPGGETGVSDENSAQAPQSGSSVAQRIPGDQHPGRVPWPTNDGRNTTFEQYRKKLGEREGGYSEKKKAKDRGGPTNKGISQRFLDALNKQHPEWKLPNDTKDLTDEQIDGIYRKEFYDRPNIQKVEAIPGLKETAPQLPEQLFDAGVHHGPKKAGQLLQESLDQHQGSDLKTKQEDGSMAYDGIVGWQTRAAIERAIKDGKIRDVNDTMADKRHKFMKGLSNYQDNPGWGSRANSFRIDIEKSPSEI